MTQLKLFACLLASLLFIPPAQGAVYKVTAKMSAAAIQSKINRAAVGDTVDFAPGIYNLASNGSNSNGAALRLVAGVTYTGPRSGEPARLVGTGRYPLMYFSGRRVTIQYLVLDNGPLFLEDRVTNATIDNNVFENIDCGSVASQTTAIFVAGGLNDSDISYNTFQNIGQTCNSQYQDKQGAGGIGLFGFHNLAIMHNSFNTVYEGVGITISNSDEYDGVGGKINYNIFSGIHRMAIEILGTNTNPSGLEVAYNHYSNALLPWAYTFGFSLTAGQNMIVHDNVINANNNKPGYVPYAVEIAGNNTHAYNNIIEGYWEWGFAIGVATNMSITNNYICGPAMAAHAPNQTAVPGNAKGFISYESNPQRGTVVSGNITSASMACEPREAKPQNGVQARK
jgi:hypothetical protein